MAGNVLEFNDANFQTEVLESSQPVLVDFWAPWCGPCRGLAPTIEQLADEYVGKVSVGKVNTEESPQTATNFGINSIPTVFLFKNGVVVDQVAGLQPKEKFIQVIDANL
jgi:thioredoxin 1